MKDIKILTLLLFGCFILSTCEKPNTSPIADFTIEPIQGNVDTVFTFDASLCSDAEDESSLLQVHWDWENDGVWDTDFSTYKIKQHQYTEPGNYTIIMEVKDVKGLLNSKEKVLSVSLSSPAVLIDSIINITSNSARINGNVTNEGSLPVTAKGICWGIEENPDINDDHTNDGDGLGEFTSMLSDLNANTIYFARAYATSNISTSYSNQVNFKTDNNTIPVITRITVTPATVIVGGRVTVFAFASDSDGDNLTYSWLPTGGAVSGTGPAVTWTAPSTAGAYSITVTVMDGNGGEASKTGTLTVIAVSSARIAGTASFIAGVNRDLSNSKVSIYTSLANWNSNAPIKFVASIGSGSSVTFMISDVLPGNYYLDVWKDVDNSGGWSMGDFVGWHGSGGLGSPFLTEFQITEGQSLTLEIDMYIF